MNKHKSPKTGKLEDCNASQRKCPYDTMHFHSQEEIDFYYQEESAARDYYANVSKLRDSELLKEFNINSSSKKATLAEYKILLSALHEDNHTYGLEDVSFYKNGKSLSPQKQDEINKILKSSNVSACHLVAETDFYYYIWTNSNENRDVVVVDKMINNLPITSYNKRSKYIEHIEVKNLINSGAQLSATPITDNNLALTDKMKKELDKYNPLQDAYFSKKLDLSEDECYQYLLEDYYQKNTHKIILYKNNKEIVLPLRQNFGSSTKEEIFKNAKDILKRNNIKVEVVIRSDIPTKTRPTQEDKNRFLRDYGCMFKDGIAKEKFTLNDLNYENRMTKGVPNKAYVRDRKTFIQDYINKESKRKDTFIRLGEFSLHTKDDVLENREYSLDEFFIHKPVLTGTIR